jgi:hypothetical protein
MDERDRSEPSAAEPPCPPGADCAPNADDALDDLAKSFAGATSRRELLRRGAAGLAGAVLAGLVPGFARADPRPNKCKDLGFKCLTNVECCSNFCEVDPAHPQGGKGGKVCSCPSTQIACNNKCVAACHPANDPCKISACNPATGQCVVANAPNGTACDTGNLCTADTCQNGACAQGNDVVTPVCPALDPTDPDTPCRSNVCNPQTGQCESVPNPAAVGTICETGNLCTADTCNANGQCVQGAVDVICPDQQCQTCNPATGICEAKANGTACDDGNPCTLNDTCQTGLCTPGTPKDCDDGNECTVDTCNPTNGQCVHTPVANGTICETGNLCTADTCQNGTCTEGAVDVICPDQQCQTCNPATGICEAKANGTACDDGNPCTLNDTCQTGLCTPGTPKTCSQPTNTCKVAVCDTTSGNCVEQNVANGTICETGNLCTADTCQNGTCAQGSVNVTCPPSTDQCKNNVCNPATGTCVLENKTNGTTCETGNLCTADTCQSGTCTQGSVNVTCPPSTDQCKNNVCNPATGTCVLQNKANGTTCNDGLACTNNDTCTNGVCAGTSTCSGSNSFCCGTSTGKPGTCQRAPGATCSNNNQCCNACVGGLCT